MNFLVQRMGLTPFDFSNVSAIAINKGDNPGLDARSFKIRPITEEAMSAVRPETRELLRKDACELARMYSDASQWDFFTLWGYRQHGFCT